ncbi:hypothetical protein NL676_009408 [Syzygium grande]|nr:hypothetical protein NL676_009408 [Syzygium grande]
MSIKDLSKLMIISHWGNFGETAKPAKPYVMAINTLASKTSRKNGMPQLAWPGTRPLELSCKRTLGGADPGLEGDGGDDEEEGLDFERQL